MTKTLSLFILILFTVTLQAQVFFSEDFETDGNGSRYFPEVEAIDGQNDFFARVQDTDHTSNFTNDYNGESGNFYWAGEDHDDAQVGGSGNPELELLFNDIDISGKSNIFLSALFGGNSQALSYEAADYVIVEYRIDNGSWLSGISFRENGNKQLAVDTNADDLGDGFILNINMEKLEFSITETGNEIDIRIRAANNSSSEEWSIDLIQLSENSTLSTSENLLKENLIIYEITNSSVFKIASKNSMQFESVKVIDLTGKQVKALNINTQLSDFELDLNGLVSAIYLLKIKTDRGVINKKIILKNKR